MYQTVTQKTTLTELTKAHALGSADRAILNLLYQHAHDSGRLGEAGAEWELPVAVLGFSKRSGKLVDCLERLMRVVVQVRLPDASTRQARLVVTSLFEFFDLPADEEISRAVVRFGISKRLSRNDIGIDSRRD